MSHDHSASAKTSRVYCRVCSKQATAGTGETWDEAQANAEALAEIVGFVMAHTPHLETPGVWLCSMCACALRGALLGRRAA